MLFFKNLKIEIRRKKNTKVKNQSLKIEKNAWNYHTKQSKNSNTFEKIRNKKSSKNEKKSKNNKVNFTIQLHPNQTFVFSKNVVIDGKYKGEAEKLMDSIEILHCIMKANTKCPICMVLQMDK